MPISRNSMQEVYKNSPVSTEIYDIINKTEKEFQSLSSVFPPFSGTKTFNSREKDSKFSKYYNNNDNNVIYI